jgi:phosphate transport system substrate-binding protein
MTAATFILVPKQPPDPVAAAEALKFFAWAYTKGDKMAEELDYVPMPKKVVEDIKRVWAREIKDSSGKPLRVSSATAQ